MIFHLNGMVCIASDNNFIAVAFPRFIYGIGQYLKYRMLAAIQTVRTKNNARTLANTVSTLEGRDALIAVLTVLLHGNNSKIITFFPSGLFVHPFRFQPEYSVL